VPMAKPAQTRPRLASSAMIKEPSRMPAIRVRATSRGGGTRRGSTSPSLDTAAQIAIRTTRNATQREFPVTVHFLLGDFRDLRLQVGHHPLVQRLEIRRVHVARAVALASKDPGDTTGLSRH